MSPPVTPSGAIVLEPPIVRAPPAIRIWQAAAAAACVIGSRSSWPPRTRRRRPRALRSTLPGGGAPRSAQGSRSRSSATPRASSSCAGGLRRSSSCSWSPPPSSSCRFPARRSSPPTRGRTGCTVALARLRAAIRTAILRARIRGTSPTLRWAARGATRRRSTARCSRSVRSSMHASRATFPSGRPGCSAWSPRFPCSAPRSSRRRSPPVPRSLRPSWAGIRCSRSTSAVAATTTR